LHFKTDDMQIAGDRFREIRGIRGGFAGHEFHELTRISFSAFLGQFTAA